jgi:hypothetical protein
MAHPARSLAVMALVSGLVLAMAAPVAAPRAAADPLGNAAVAPSAPAKPLAEAERLTMLARAGQPSCASPWTYSVGLHRCICIREGYSLQWGQCLKMPGALPLTAAALESGALRPADPSERMEKIAQAQDCMASLGLYHGLVDGEAGKATREAFAAFADQYGVAAEEGLFSQQAQAALAGACGDQTATLSDSTSSPPQ